MLDSIKLKVGRYLKKVKLAQNGDRVYLTFPYNKALIQIIKDTFQGIRWHGFDAKPIKKWSIPMTQRNIFTLLYLSGQDPYAPYNISRRKFEITSGRPLYEHQEIMVNQIMTYRQCILAAEMGTGKTLPVIETLEMVFPESDYDQASWYIGPKSGVMAVNLEFEKWEANVHPWMLTYEGLLSFVKEHDFQICNPPKFIVLDESSKIKNPKAQRSKAVACVTDSMREVYGLDCYVVELSGTPAPRSPVDWWHQCEIACPGFLSEPSLFHMRKRLALIVERESSSGVYPHVVTWLDDEKKCNICGKYEDDEAHPFSHKFEPSRNEVGSLYHRLKGLVLVQFKKDCLDLPEKQYRVMRLKPEADTLRAAKLIAKTSTRAIEVLTRLRELSDGFQYIKKEAGEETCPNCFGEKIMTIKVGNIETDDPEEMIKAGFHDEEVPCTYCGGKGTVIKYVRDTEYAESPKDEALRNIMDDHDEIGRLIVWGGFTGSIDKIIQIALTKGWVVLSVDGRGYRCFSALETPSIEDLLKSMDASHKDRSHYMEQYPKVCFVGHPQAGGMSLTLTASPTEVFYSNSFSGEARMQSEDRFHRVGMDVNRGATIIDFIHLKTDQLVLDNLRKKKDLQSLTMGEVQQALEIGD